MIIARPVIAPVDIRTFKINYPWLTEDETIIGATVEVIPPEEDENVPPLFQPNGMIAPDGKSLYLRTGYDPNVGPPLDATEYLANITVITDKDQQNYDSVLFVVNDRVC